ncbi:MAG: LamG domain-containing protein [bacterium]
MLKIKLFLVIAVVLYFTGFIKAVSGEEAEAQQASQKQFLISLDITDGSRVVGAPSGFSVKLNTLFAELDIPWKEIQSVELKDDNETVSVKFRNGDRLTGTLFLKSIELKTVFGEVSVGIQQIKKIIVQAAGILSREGLAAYYPFNGNANDESGNGNSGIVHGAVLAKDKFGNNDRAYSFDGIDDNIEVPDSGSLDLTNTLTVTMWFKPGVDIKPDNPYYYSLLVKWHGTGSQWRTGYFIQLKEKTIVFGRGHGAGKWSQLYGTEHTWNADVWYHVAITHDISLLAGNGKIYINGVLDSQDNEKRPLDVNTLPLFINVDPFELWHSQNRYFKGVINEVRIYNRALSESEVRELYDIGK